MTPSTRMLSVKSLTVRGLCLAVFLSASPAFGDDKMERQDGSSPEDQEFKAEAPDRPTDMPLAQIPEPPSLRLVSPRPRALEAIELLLSQLISPEELVRERASRSLLEAKTDWVSGLSKRIDRLAERANRKAMKELLSDARAATRERLKSEVGGKVDTPDYLSVVLEHPEPGSQDWRDLTQLLGLSRMLGAIGTTEAAREIIRIYVRFGDFMRIDCQRQLLELGDRSVAALLDSTRHPAPKFATWAEKRLKLRKKLNPDDAVRTEDETALADILVALGRGRNPESTPLLISFSGTEKAQIRMAARQGIALLGDVASWQLRDAYLNTTGKRPPRDWTWKRTARELFTEFDRLRLEKLYKLYADAVTSAKKGDLIKMREGYDKILVLSPEFDRRSDMAAGYLDAAKAIMDSEPDTALICLTRIERISQDKAILSEALGLRSLIEAKRLREEGVIDQELVKRAIQLAPDSDDEARALLQTGGVTAAWGRGSRYLVAFSVAALALLGAAWIFFTSWFRKGDVSNSGSPSDPPSK